MLDFIKNVKEIQIGGLLFTRCQWRFTLLFRRGGDATEAVLSPLLGHRQLVQTGTKLLCGPAACEHVEMFGSA